MPRPNLRGRDGDDWDEQVADLQYRDARGLAAGHGVTTRARVGEDGACREVETTWTPTAEVEKVIAGSVPGKVELSGGSGRRCTRSA